MFWWRIASHGDRITRLEHHARKNFRPHARAASNPMNAQEIAERDEEEVYFRCPIPSDQAKAVLLVGRRSIPILVQEASIDAFTVLVAPRYSSKLKVGRPWTLEYDGTRTEIHPQWIFNSPDGQVQLGLRRLRDLTPQPHVSRSFLTKVGGKRYEDPSFSAAAYGGFVLFLFALMALPGLGDRLGTAPRIESAIRWVMQGIDKAISQSL